MKVIRISKGFRVFDYATNGTAWWKSQTVYYGAKTLICWSEAKKPNMKDWKVEDVTRLWHHNLPVAHRKATKKIKEKRRLIYQSY